MKHWEYWSTSFLMALHNNIPSHFSKNFWHLLHRRWKYLESVKPYVNENTLLASQLW